MNNVKMTVSSNNVSGKNVSINIPYQPTLNKNTTGYVNAEEFLDIILETYSRFYGDTTLKGHPEDIYLNVSSIMESVYTTLDKINNINRRRND